MAYVYRSFDEFESQNPLAASKIKSAEEVMARHLNVSVMDRLGIFKYVLMDDGSVLAMETGVWTSRWDGDGWSPYEDDGPSHSQH